MVQWTASKSEDCLTTQRQPPDLSRRPDVSTFRPNSLSKRYLGVISPTQSTLPQPGLEQIKRHMQHHLGSSGSGFKLFGARESGAEFGQNDIPSAYSKDYLFPDTVVIQQLIDLRMNLKEAYRSFPHFIPPRCNA